jgi:glycosyltransferase involved in cell wall biosynthesis
MRALHLIAGNLYGGVEALLTLIARRRDLAGDVEHHYGVCFDGRLAEELTAAGAPVHRLGRMRTSRPWTVLAGRRELAKLLLARRFDVAITHSSWPHAMFAPVLARAGVPVVFYLHNPLAKLGWLDRWAGRTSPTTVVAVSRHTLGTARSLFPDAPGEVLYHPIIWDARPEDAAARAEVRAELGAAPSDVVLLQASRAEPWKGHDQLLAALAELRSVPGWRLWLAGGAQRPHEQAFVAELTEQARSAGLDDRVRFLGERRDVPRLLAAADLYCQANRGPEGFSIVFMEAFGAGLPIVTMRLGGAPELIDETCGVLVAPGDVHGFATALRSLIADAPRREALGASAKARLALLCDPAARMHDLRTILAAAASQSARR